jgi:hypothetical protein
VNPNAPKAKYETRIISISLFIGPNIMNAMDEARIIAIPPIVGVPDFTWCDFGPSSRMLCPALIFFNKGIKANVKITVNMKDTNKVNAKR